MKKIIGLFSFALILCTLMVPASAYASTGYYQDNSKNKSTFTFFSSIFTYFQKDDSKYTYQSDSYNKNDQNNHYTDYKKDSWWDSLIKWCSNDGNRDRDNNHNGDKNSNYDNDCDNWWDFFKKWCGGDNDHDDDHHHDNDDHDDWGNDNGDCTSAYIWRNWYN